MRVIRCRERVLPFTRLTPSCGGAKVRMRGLGKRWRGIVSVLTPVVVGVVLAYGWSAANTRMVAAFRPRVGELVTSQAFAGRGPSSWSVDGTGATTEAPPLTSRGHVGQPSAGQPSAGQPGARTVATGVHPGSGGPRRSGLVVTSGHDKHHKRRSGPRADRGGARVPLPRPSRPVAIQPTTASTSPGIADNSGAPRTPDHTRSVRLPHEEVKPDDEGRRSLRWPPSKQFMPGRS
jgi:hypothetical protein